MAAYLLRYCNQQPIKVGVYACKIPIGAGSSLFEDVFLLWDGRKWYYLSSDQAYRGTVLEWLGPLPRALQK